VFDTAPFSIHGRPEADSHTAADAPKRMALWVRDPAGHLAMQASAQFDCV